MSTFKTVVSKAVRVKRDVTSSVFYRNPSIIIIATLVTVIAWQNFSYAIVLPVFANEHEYTVVKSDTIKCDYECLTRAWVTLRTEEILVENEPEYRMTARIQALLEANSLITQI